MASFLNSSSNTSQRGSAIMAALGVAAIVGTLSYTAYGLLSGPVRTAAIVTLKTKSQNELMIGAKLLLRSATDSDADSVLEPIAADPATAVPKGGTILSHTGGGGIPNSIGAEKSDPWHTPYAYCVWDHGTSFAGGTGIIAGTDTNYATKIVVALFSAGPDRIFQTTCTTGGVLTTGGDDIVFRYTYDEAAGAGGLWKETAGVGIETIASGQNVGIGKAADASRRLDVLGVSHFDGNITSEGGTLTAGTVDINGGAIDGTTIGASTPAAGTFTNLTASGTGAINGITVGNVTPAAGTFTALTANTSLTTGMAGTVTLNNNVHIAGDNSLSRIDGVRIGVTTPNTGRFTNLDWTGTLTPPSTAVVTNLNADLLDGQEGTYYTNATNLASGTVPAARMPALTGDVTTTVGTVATSVVRLQGRALNSTAPGTNQVIGWNGSAWAPMTVAAGSGSATVVGASGVNFLGTDTNITSGACSSTQIPKYNGTTWACAADAIGSATLPFNADNASTPTGQIVKVNTSENFLAVRATDNTLLGRRSGQGFYTSGLTASYNTFLGALAGQAVNNNSTANNTLVGYNTGTALTYALSNTYIGSSAGTGTAFGLTGNTLVGAAAGGSLSNSYNTMIGASAGLQSGASTSSNVFIGANVASNTSIASAAGNVLIGSGATAATAPGAAFTSATGNVFIGDGVGLANNSTNNVFIGKNTCAACTSNGIVAIGEAAGGTSVTGGQSNILIGRNTGSALTSSYNVIIGDNAGTSQAANGGVVIIGDNAGANNTASGNVIIGSGAGGRTITGGTNIFIGKNVAAAGAAGSLTGTYNIVFGSGDSAATSPGYSLTSGNSNLIMGYRAGVSLATGVAAVMIGPQAGEAATAGAVTLVGERAGYNVTGTGNSYFGSNAGNRNTSGTSNTAVGYGAMGDTTTVAPAAPAATSTGSSNVSVGAYSGQGVTSGGSNVFIGHSAGNAVASASNNTMVGYQAGLLTTGATNTMLGYQAGSSNVGGANNIYIGPNAGTGNATGSGNIAIGANAPLANGTANTLLIYGNGGTAITGTMNSGNLSVQGTSWTYLSDERLKKDIHEIDHATDSLVKLRGVTFKWNGISNKDTKSTNYGVIAQEVKKVLPDLVTEYKTENGKKYWQVAYNYFIPLLIESVKERQKTLTEQDKILDQQGEQIEQQQKMIAEMQGQLKKLQEKSAAHQ